MRICNAKSISLLLFCTLPHGHAGNHEAWLLVHRLASWPNVPGPTAVPVAPPAPAQPADPDPPTGTLPGGPDPDGTDAPDPRPKPIDYSDWLSEEDLL